VSRPNIRQPRSQALIFVALLAFLQVSASRDLPAAPLKLDSPFDIEAVRFVKQTGNATVRGQAFLKLADGTSRSCAGFAIELLPVAAYSDERIFKTYGNNRQGQILLEQNPPKFTPDVKEYHEMLLKGACDASGEFQFEKVAAGDYYVMAFIIWEATPGDAASKTGGGVMKWIRVEPGSNNVVRLN
jgi:hypothetical protein